MPKMSDHGDPGLRGSQGFSGGWAIHAPGMCWLLRDHLFDGIHSVHAGLATRIGFHGLCAGLERLPLVRSSLYPRIHIHEPNDFDAFSKAFLVVA